ncbi:hypothetical protein PoB_007123800 [Plakobranchus ocellatus]|uniref:Uncharacterized protein n=1 Tax=Plakobranchus ocellatus TaxID=259542 RepID=A0AAV4DKC9_9GAST|nr:hypothetical protein PoB_007123800 [Plakobranchus ocellatus]
MSTFNSNDLLSTLVEKIRLICEQKIHFDDFTSVSGLICFDIDGIKQQCFVISELVQKTSAGEGCSAHLKTLCWKDIATTKPLELNSKEIYTSQISHHKTPACDEQYSGPSELQKSFNSSPVGCAKLQAKLDWSNRTFTLVPLEQDGAEQSSKSPLKNTSNTTIVVPISQIAGQKEKKENLQLNFKKDIYQRFSKEHNVIGSRWPKPFHSTKTHTNYRNCYPGLPNKALKRCKPVFDGKCSDSLRNKIKCEPLKEVYNLQNSCENLKTLDNSTSEKPTDLSWFERVISPSNSVESIDSIQPCYLVPHSEPLTSPQYLNNEIKDIFDNSNIEHMESAAHNVILKHNTAPQVNVPDTGSQAESILAQIKKPGSPLKTVAAHSSTSNGTLNTISSIEPDMITLKGNNSDVCIRKTTDCAIPTSVSPSRHSELQSMNECSTNIKKGMYYQIKLRLKYSYSYYTFG